MGNSMSSGTWGPPAGSNLFSPHGSLNRSAVPRPTRIRQILCRVCKDMTTKAMADNPDNDEARSQFWPISAVKEQTELLLGTPLEEAELVALYDTLGSSTNGGGMFEIRKDKDGNVTSIRWIPSLGPMETLLNQLGGGINNLGEVGSPVIGSLEGGGWGGPHRA